MCQCGHEHDDEVKHDQIGDRKVWYIDLGDKSPKEIEASILNYRDQLKGLPAGTSLAQRKREDRIFWAGFTVVVITIIAVIVLSAVK